MASANGTTAKTAKNMMNTSKSSRPATGGNKNVNATRKAQGMPVPAGLTRPLVGPDKGTG